MEYPCIEHYPCGLQHNDDLPTKTTEQTQNKPRIASKPQEARVPSADAILQKGCQLPPGIKHAGIGLPPGIKLNNVKSQYPPGAVIDPQENDGFWGAQEEASSAHEPKISLSKGTDQCTHVRTDAADYFLPPGIKLGSNHSVAQYHPILPDSATQTPQISALSAKTSSVEGMGCLNCLHN